MKKIDRLSNKGKMFSQISIGQIFYENICGKIAMLKMVENPNVAGAYAFMDTETGTTYHSFINIATRFSRADYLQQKIHIAGLH